MENKALIALLISNGLSFIENQDRMSYGQIGVLAVKDADETSVTIFPATFYVTNSMFSVTQERLGIIKLIQAAFKDVSRNDKGIATPIKLNV